MSDCDALYAKFLKSVGYKFYMTISIYEDYDNSTCTFLDETVNTTESEIDRFSSLSKQNKFNVVYERGECNHWNGDCTFTGSYKYEISKE